MAHGLVRSVSGFATARFVLGIAEAGNFPSCFKAVRNWFPPKDRALATGIFNAGTNVGALAAPIVVPWLTLAYGWPAAFYVTGAIGMLWVIAWAAFYRNPEEHPRVSAGELAYIRSGEDEGHTAPLSYRELLRYRATWAYAVVQFLTSPVWWFYLFWLPDFLNKTHGLDLALNWTTLRVFESSLAAWRTLAMTSCAVARSSAPCSGAEVTASTANDSVNRTNECRFIYAPINCYRCH